MTVAVSPDGSVPFNTPLLFVGERKGLDFVFREPLIYAKPMSFFYPQVAATDEGIVLVGQIWDQAPEVTGRLIQLDWEGNELARQEFRAEGDGMPMAWDMRPADREWRRLIIYRTAMGKDAKGGRHELWEYDPATRQGERLRVIEAEAARMNGAKWIPNGAGDSLLINNPCLQSLFGWRGDLLGNGTVRSGAIAGGDPIALGYQTTNYLMTPNGLQGSLEGNGPILVATDCKNPTDGGDGNAGMTSLLLWELILP